MNWPSDVSILAAVGDSLSPSTQLIIANWVRRQYVGETVSIRTIIEHVSRSLWRLESDGLVTRRRSADDRRVWEYYAN